MKNFKLINELLYLSSLAASFVLLKGVINPGDIIRAKALIVRRSDGRLIGIRASRAWAKRPRRLFIVVLELDSRVPLTLIRSLVPAHLYAAIIPFRCRSVSEDIPHLHANSPSNYTPVDHSRSYFLYVCL